MRNDDVITPVILSGGSGTRLWPLSTDARPKQFLNLTGPLSMFQMTLERCQETDLFRTPIIVGGAKHASLAEQQMEEIGTSAAAHILEPCARNTAPAIALAALACENPQTVLLVMPCDHVIKNVSAFQNAVRQSLPLAKARWLVTFGIEPTGPETGYGYIQQGEPIVGSLNSFAAQRFVEKPNRENAEKMLASGDYFWNAGIFLFRADTYLQALGDHAPEMLEAARNAMDRASSNDHEIRPDEASFAGAPSDSIDYAVMEKTDNAVVIPIDVNWNDVGSWSALWEVSPKDDKGNTLKGDIIAHETENCFIQNNGKLIATLGISDSVVIETDDAILVAAKNRVQEVKTIVKQLKQDNRKETQLHRKVFRPWGYYDSIENGTNFQVKRLAVYPNAKLSLQKHQHRAEHWVVVSGVAEVTNGDEVFRLEVNQSTYIPQNTVHRLSNPADTILEVIEVQTGSYLGEDDIERLDDIYSRHNY